MRKLIEYFIRYHVAVNVIVLAFAFFGVFGYIGLKSSFFPLADSKNITISVAYPGASPQEVEEGIVLKIEDNLKRQVHQNTVKLDIKELLNKEQIGFKELYTDYQLFYTMNLLLNKELLLI